MGKYILVVDDKPSIRLLMYELLRDAGYQVKCISSGKECLNIARSPDKPALIILDHKMPKLTGLEVLSILKSDQETKDIPVIMITGIEDIIDEAINWGASMVLLKPFDIKKLKKVLSDLVHM
jgi:CheY-like chemotaxis protein